MLAQTSHSAARFVRPDGYMTRTWSADVTAYQHVLGILVPHKRVTTGLTRVCEVPRSPAWRTAVHFRFDERWSSFPRPCLALPLVERCIKLLQDVAQIPSLLLCKHALSLH